MRNLEPFGVVEHPNDFKSLITIDLGCIVDSFVQGYVVETRKLVGCVLENDQGSELQANTIQRRNNGVLEFSPRRLKLAFDSLMQRDYFELIGYHPDLNKDKKYLKISDFLKTLKR